LGAIGGLAGAVVLLCLGLAIAFIKIRRMQDQQIVNMIFDKKEVSDEE